MTSNILDRRPGTPARLLSDFLNDLSITAANTAGELSKIPYALPFPEQPGDDIDRLNVAMLDVVALVWRASALLEDASGEIA